MVFHGHFDGLKLDMKFDSELEQKLQKLQKPNQNLPMEIEPAKPKKDAGGTGTQENVEEFKSKPKDKFKNNM